jgi:paraquat-inducible protein B
MSKHSNPTLIGAFVVGAISLLVIAVALLGGSEYFAKRLNYVAYFEESTKGLRVGSNVLLNGVRVGYVSDITLLVDQQTYESMTQVTMEILPESFVITDVTGEVVKTSVRIQRISHDLLVEQARLRAQLEIESFITGTLVVSLKMGSDQPAVFRGVNPPYLEIPTIPSSVQALLAKIRNWFEKAGDDFNLEEIANRMSNILKGMDELVNSPDLRAALAGANEFINNEQLQQLAGKVASTLDEVKLMAADARTLVQDVNTEVDGVGEELRPAFQKLAAVMERAEQTLEAATEQLKGETVQMYQLQATLEEVESAAFALREFFDYLERNPDSLIRGKKE